MINYVDFYKITLVSQKYVRFYRNTLISANKHCDLINYVEIFKNFMTGLFRSHNDDKVSI